MTRTRVGVLVSGPGTNLRALCEAAEGKDFPAEIVLVVTNRASAGALAIARERGIPTEVVPLEAFHGHRLARDLEMTRLLRLAGVELVVCAGYNRVLTHEFLAAFPDAIINVHPSLLPAFAGGMNAVQAALDAGVRVSGCTVHLLEPGETDGGPIILQAPVVVERGDTAEALRQRIHEQEWRLLPEAVSLWCHGRLRREGHHILITDESGLPAS